ncbi:MAG: hypothetical protein AB1400_08840 [Pseudomonadota bacterium]
MAQYSFGAGVLFARQLTDASGTAIANPTPIEFGVLQDVTLDVSFDLKQLYGQNQFPVAMARGKGKITGKAKAAEINGGLLNGILFGQTLATGLVGVFKATSTTTVAATITVAPPAAGTYQKDLGVYSATDGKPYTRVASAPALDQYTVNEATGAYTFNTGDIGALVYIDYSYTAAAGGVKSTVVNLPMGYTPTFSIDLNLDYNGKKATIQLPNCTSDKVGIATKLEDFMIPEFSFQAFADAMGNVMTYSFTE